MSTLVNQSWYRSAYAWMEDDVFRLHDTSQAYKLEVRWNGWYSKSVRDSLKAIIESLYGVESVELYQYTLAVYFATHVIGKAELAARIKATIQNYIDSTSDFGTGTAVA